MPISISPNQLFAKKADGTGYLPANVISGETTETQCARVTAQGTTEVQRVQTKAQEVTSQLANAAEVRDMIAGTFSSSTNYTAGQIVIVTNMTTSVNELWRFTTDHPAGNWIGTDAVKIKLANDVSDLKSALKVQEDYKADKIINQSVLTGETKSGKLYNSSTKAFNDIGNPAKAIVYTTGFIANQKVIIDGWTFTSATYKTVVFLDSSDNILASYRGATASQSYIVTCDIPEGTAKIILNGRNDDATATLLVVDNSYGLAEAKEDIDQAKQDIDNLEDTVAHKFVKYSEIAATVQTGKMLNVKTFNGDDAEIDNAKYIILTSGFTAGDIVAITGKNGGNATYGMVGFWSDSAVLEYDSLPLSTEVTRKIFTVPEGTTQIRINGGSSVTPKIEEVTYCDLETVNQDMNTGFTNVDNSIDRRIFDINNAFDRIIAKQKQNPFIFRPFDKPIISFVFDDIEDDISLVESIFHTNNIPCGFAAIPYYLNRTTLDGRKAKDVLHDAEAHGSEVLCHSNTVMKDTTTDELVWQNFVGNKITLTNEGYNITGIIKTGGTGSDTFDFKRCERYLRCYYDFSDMYGQGLGMPNFYTNNRIFMKADLDWDKARVDDAIRNNSWVILSAHGVEATGDDTNITQETLEGIIAYVLSKDVYVYTPRQVIEKYGGCQATSLES